MPGKDIRRLQMHLIMLINMRILAKELKRKINRLGKIIIKQHEMQNLTRKFRNPIIGML